LISLGTGSGVANSSRGLVRSEVSDLLRL
jgi:hypothetical protein